MTGGAGGATSVVSVFRYLLPFAQLPFGAYRPSGSVEPLVSLEAASKPSDFRVVELAPSSPLLTSSGCAPQGSKGGGVEVSSASAEPAGSAAGCRSGAPAV